MQEDNVQVSKRTFLKLLLIPFLIRNGAVRAKGGNQIDIEYLGIPVPAWLFGDSNSIDTTYIKSIEPKDNHSRFSVRFANGKSLNLSSNTTVQSLINTNNGKISRKSHLLKRTISYCLDGIFNSVLNKRNHMSSNQLRKDFEGLQVEEILGEISLGNIYDFLDALRKMDKITTVKWNKNKAEIEVY